MIRLHRVYTLSNNVYERLQQAGSPAEWDAINRQIQDRSIAIYYASNDSYIAMSIIDHRLYIHLCDGRELSILLALMMQTAQHNDCISIDFRTRRIGLIRMIRRRQNVRSFGRGYYRIEL